ncbi:hypothetical protein [Corynebacterium sp. UBA2622]|uniref:hypothetical protein n=1 Tax=Corynebacterium sp. UBA2622 TaxID=1946393 RepID=UPI0025C18FEE|nr:hypothetical protein [Corynebacterium sp. UBA2622]
MPGTTKPAAVRWKDAPEEHDYPAAASYLSLVAPAQLVDSTVAALREAPITLHKAKDVLRAAQLPLLPADNEHVARDLDKIAKGRDLSPVLIVRGDLARGLPAQIADGYHRVCASYHTDENVDVPARIVDHPAAG